MFTWDDSQSEGFRDEVDIEVSRWGDPKAKNAQYVIQPFFVPENLSRFVAPPGTLTHQFRWQAGNVSFKTYSGPESSAEIVKEHAFTSGVPKSTNEKVHIDLYDFHHAESGLQQPVEVVIEKFEYVH